VEQARQSEHETAVAQDLLLYTGVLVRFLIPRNGDTAMLDDAIIMIKSDMERSVQSHLPSGCIAEFQNMA
jgi:hypothetical protein